MTETNPHTDEHPIDRAVRAHLEREAGRIDAAGLLGRVKAAHSPAAVPRGPGRSWVRYVAGAAAGLAIAASVTLMFVLGGGPEPRQATAAEIIREAQTVHEAPSDRCYEVVAEWEPLSMQRLKLDPVTRRGRLWTRGDMFWLASTGPAGNPVALGQGKDGRLWAAYGRRRGVVFDKAEAGEPLARYADLMSLRAVSTLGELLERYELFRRDAGRPGEPIRIEADLRQRAGRPDTRFRTVSLELDPATKVIRKATLGRQLNGEPLGTLTFTLRESGTQPDEAYEVTGHLDAGARITDAPEGAKPPAFGPVGPGPRPPRAVPPKGPKTI